MEIQLGTVAAIGFDDLPPAETLACYRQLGCRCVQAYRNHNAGITAQQMLDAIAAGQMPCDSLHGVYGPPFDPSNPDESARRSAVDAFKSEGELALQLGGPLVVVHVGDIVDKPIGAEEHAIRRDQLGKSIAELGGFGRQMGVEYAFENLPAYHAIGSNVAELAGVLVDVAAPNTGMCYDTGHAHMVCDSAGAVAETRGQIRYVHFSDNHGQADDHEMPTYGTLDCEAVARALHSVGFGGTMMLEVFYGVDKLKQLIDEGCGERLGRIIDIANGRLETAPG